MFELNEQEMEQIAGGHHHNSYSHAWTTTDASAKKGHASSDTQTRQHSGHNYSDGKANNSSEVCGTNISLSTGAGTSSHGQY
ncbi:hypothetical protein EPA93_04870 [Ktedonosporobacter rubrisoli]|uniref:Bacteriocin n=1 Tax=Ktedonosporobacter rubrisoli TaxID=2509675 RepID=A0A4P6JJS0_KTERU|nr:hypothetical protein [Ktedonosporobacter rubrisoli]QBD75368.1 hypothetical protein EPA93_04870 [Ktedonosporobacter rubrisoli]